MPTLRFIRRYLPAKWSTRLLIASIGVIGLLRFWPSSKLPTVEPPTPRLKSCTEFVENESERKGKRNIVYVPILRSASTTLHNMFARYAIRHNLNVVLPQLHAERNSSCKYCFTSLKRRDIVPIPSGQQYNVLINRHVFNRPSIKRVVPPGTFYCTMMRDPFARFKSTLHTFPEVQDLKELAFNTTVPYQKFSDAKIQEETELHPYSHLIFNRASQDTGLSMRQSKNKNDMWRHIRLLDKYMNLVMIMEQFSESLILLKRKAHLDWQDILYLHKGKQHGLIYLDDPRMQTFMKWQRADNEMYLHFLTKLSSEVAKEGHGFYQEMGAFVNLQFIVRDYCQRVYDASPLYVEETKWNNEFNWTRRDCDLAMVRDQDGMTEILIERAEDKLMCS